MAGKNKNTLIGLLAAVTALTRDIRGINQAAIRSEATGNTVKIGGGNPWNPHNLTDISFWEQVFRRQDQARARALGINTTPAKLAEMAGAGGIGRAGYSVAIGNQMSMLATGLDAHLDVTKELGLQMRVVGMNEGKLYQTLRQGQVIGGINNKQTENLSKVMFDLGQKYTISTEALAESVQKVIGDINLATLGKTGIASKLNAEIAAAFGPQAEQLVTAIQTIYATGQTLGYDIRLGAETLADNMADSIDSFKAYAKVYAKEFGNYLSTFPKHLQAFAADQARQIYGPIAQLSFNAINALSDENRRSPGEGVNKFSTIQNAIQTLYTPMDRLAQTVIPTLSDNIVALTAALIVGHGIGLAAQGIGALGGIRGVGAAFALGLPGIMAFLPEIAAVVGGAIFIGGGLWWLISTLTDNSEEQTNASKEQLNIAKRKDFEERAAASQKSDTAKFMELQADAINTSMEMIMFNGDLARRLAADSDKKKIELAERLLTAIHKLDNKYNGPPKPNSVMGGAN